MSSTYQDLVAEREAVHGRLARDGYDVVRMEDFGSRDDVALETCLEALESCQCYVLILGARYGTIEPTYHLSYTHVEYERARELGIPVLAYVREGIDDPAGKESDDYLRLLDFREIIERSHTVRRPYFASPDQLAEQVAADLGALAKTLSVRPAFGRTRRSIGDPLAYAGRSVRRSKLKLNPLVVVVADLSVLDEEQYPEGRGRRMRDKVSRVLNYLDREGASALLFNEISAPGHQPVVEQRLAEVRTKADVIVALVHGKSDVQNVTAFDGADGKVAAWCPDHVELPEVTQVRMARYTQDELQQCGLGLRVEQYLDAVIDEHLTARLG